jgi:hypothetical protein
VSDNPFSAANLHDTLADAIKSLPEGKTGGLFIDGTYADGRASAKVIYVQKAGDHVQIATVGEYDGKHVSGKVIGAITW